MPNSKEIEATSHKLVSVFRDGGNIFIKVDPVEGPNDLATFPHKS
jgi:hypothetical protein